MGIKIFEDTSNFVDRYTMRKENTFGIILIYFLFYMVIGVSVGSAIVLKLSQSGKYSYIEINSFIINFQFVLDLLVLPVLIFLARDLIRNDFFKISSLKQYATTVLIFAGAMLIVNITVGVLYTLISGVETTENQEAIVQILDNNILYTFFTVNIFAPIVEELVFRGALYNILLKSNGKIMAIFLSSSIFGFLHVFSSIASQNYMEIFAGFAYVAIGLVLGYAYYKTNNILICIGIHFVNNFASFLSMIS